MSETCGKLKGHLWPCEACEAPKHGHQRPLHDATGCVVKKGDPKKIKILTQTVLGRKKTTTVSEFEHFHIKPQILAEDLKNKCSGSTAIGPSKHNPAVLEVMVQGPHGPTIIDYLKEKGVPISFIDFEDKSKSKKKRS